MNITVQIYSKKTGTDYSMSVLVAGEGHFTGEFGHSHPQLKAVQSG